LSHFSPQAKDTQLLAQYGLDGKFVAGYIGTHGMAHALETLLGMICITPAKARADT